VSYRCRDSILYRLVLAYFTAHNDWASQHNITIMCRAIPQIMCSFPAITRQTQDTFPHSCDAFPRIIVFYCASSHSCASSCFIMHHCILLCIFAFSCIFAFHRASSRFIAHLRVSLCIFMFHCASLCSIMHLRISSQCSAHHRRSIHPLSSQFLGASHSIYYYI